MKIRKGLQRLLSVFLAVLMVVSVIPASVQAEGTETYQKISSAGEFETGSYVMVTDTGYAVGGLDGTWAVSYTHLDVYKRQISVSAVTFEGRGIGALSEISRIHIDCRRSDWISEGECYLCQSQKRGSRTGGLRRHSVAWKPV